jgi:hypothetical protein
VIGIDHVARVFEVCFQRLRIRTCGHIRRDAQAQRTLRVGFPTELIEVFSESDGVAGKYGLGLVWPLKRMVADNLSFRSNIEFRELYMPFDCLLFFGDAGNGDQFAYSIRGGAIRSSDVFAWDHESDSRQWVAPSLRTYLEWWLTGRIKL